MLGRSYVNEEMLVNKYHAKIKCMSKLANMMCIVLKGFNRLRRAFHFTVVRYILKALLLILLTVEIFT